MESKEKSAQTRIDNNLVMIRGLAGIAVLCIVVSVLVILRITNIESIRDILAIIFVPVGTIVGGFIGRLSGTNPS